MTLITAILTFPFVWLMTTAILIQLFNISDYEREDATYAMFVVTLFLYGLIYQFSN